MVGKKTADKGEKWIPTDTFGARLALIRQRFGWNVVEAAEACSLNDETWRQWEKTGRTPRNVFDVARKIADATGCDYDWLVVGGDLARSRWAAPAALRILPGGSSGPARMNQMALPLFAALVDN